MSREYVRETRVLFQFLQGLIKTKLLQKMIEFIKSFQFLQGLIKTHLSFLFFDENLVFQFLQGLIKTVEKPKDWKEFRNVSIPTRSD